VFCHFGGNIPARARIPREQRGVGVFHVGGRPGIELQVRVGAFVFPHQPATLTCVVLFECRFRLVLCQRHCDVVFDDKLQHYGDV
jgi:hypothetical protein